MDKLVLMAGRVLDKYGPEHQRPVDRCDADIIKQLSVGEWKQKADRMRSGFYRHTTDFRVSA